MKEEILTDIGLTSSEAKVYLALVQSGLSSATEVSKESGLHQSNAYDALTKLISRGLASKIEKGTTTLYSASDPKALLRLLKDKENQLESILPQLELAKNMAGSKGSAKVSEGLNAVFELFYGFLEYKDDILVYGIPNIVPDIVKYKIKFYHEERIKQKVKMIHIYNHNAQDRIAYLNALDYTEAKYLPEKYDSKVSTFVCGEEVAFVVWEPLTVIKVINKNLAEAYKNYFNLLWKDAK